MPPVAILCWVILLGSVVIIFVKKQIDKKKLANVNLEIDHDWLENSLDKYYFDNVLHQYYFHHDKDFFHQGHVMEDKNHNVVYEADFLINNMMGNDDVDFYNHIINYKHHHKVSHTTTSSFGSNHSSIVISSSFNFDNKDIWQYLYDLGYDYNFIIKGLAYEVEIYKGDEIVGHIYSSNNGKNLYESLDHKITAKMGGKGICIVETKYEDLDVAFLYAMAFARTDLGIENI